MDDILLADSDKDVLRSMFKVTQKILPCWVLRIAPEKIQRGDAFSYLDYKINQQQQQQKIPLQKVQIDRDQLKI